MADLLRNASAWLEGMRRTHATSPVAYRRNGTVLAAAAQATVGKTVAEVANADGSITQMTVRDYLIDAADLLLAGDPAEPAAGDQITDPAEANAVYEVLALPNGETHRRSDPYGLTWRIHCKLVQAGTA